MAFRLTGLSPQPFKHLFGLSDEQLAMEGVKRYVVDRKPCFPDRIEVRDLELGETALLLNYTHQPADTPYRSSHAIFVREGAEIAYDAIDEIPEVMRVRTMSLRSFDAEHMMLDADVVEGSGMEGVIDRFFANPEAQYIQAHYAKRECYAARIERT